MRGTEGREESNTAFRYVCDNLNTSLLKEALGLATQSEGVNEEA